MTLKRKVNMFNYGVFGLLAFLAQAIAQDLDDTTVGMPSFWENREGLEWAESAPARLAMVKAKAMKAKAAAMKAAPKAKAKKAAPKKAAMKVSKKAELVQGESFFTQVALYGLVAAGSFSLGLFFRRKSSSASEEAEEPLYKNIGA